MQRDGAEDDTRSLIPLGKQNLRMHFMSALGQKQTFAFIHAEIFLEKIF